MTQEEKGPTFVVEYTPLGSDCLDNPNAAFWFESANNCQRIRPTERDSGGSFYFGCRDYGCEGQTERDNHGRAEDAFLPPENPCEGINE